MENDALKLVKVNLRRLNPLGHLHMYNSFLDADKHLRNRCRVLETYAFSTYSCCVEWENGHTVRGELTIDSSMQNNEHIVQDFVNLSLANDLLLYTLLPCRNDLRNMVLRLQWQMERLLQEPEKKSRALDIIMNCEGVDKNNILSSYEMLRNIVDSVDYFLPLLKKVFPNAQQKLQNIRMLQKRSKRYVNSAVKDFKKLAVAVISHALNNEATEFKGSWDELVDFCVTVSEEQKYADERLTALGKELYLISPADASLIKEAALGQVKPFTEEASQEFFARNDKIKLAYYNMKERVHNKKELNAEDNLYLELYASGYLKNEGERLSRLDLSIYTTKSLMDSHKLGQEHLKSLISRNDPMAVQFSAYPDIVLQAACIS